MPLPDIEWIYTGLDSIPNTTTDMPDLTDESAPGADDGHNVRSSHVEAVRDLAIDNRTEIGVQTSPATGTLRARVSDLEDEVVTQNGFVDRSETTIAFDDGNRRLTITPTGADYTFFDNGDKYVKSSPDTYDIPDVEGLHFIYYNGGTLASSQVFSPFIISEYAYVAVVYWDATNSEAILVGDERHGREMDAATHSWAHNGLGTLYDSGLAPGNIVADGAGDMDAHCQLDLTDGVIRDEDIRIEITDGSPQELTPILQAPIFYRLGVSGDWRRITATDFPVTTTGSGRAAWNEFTGGAWQLTETTDQDFVLAHVFATNDVEHPIVVVMGQAEYVDIGTARTGANDELNALALGSLVGLFVEFRPIATLIIQTDDTYTNTVKSRVRTNDEGGDFIDFRTAGVGPGSGASAADHGNLSGLGDSGDHLWAIASDRAGDITALTEKVTPTVSDWALIEDAADSDNKKKVQLGNIPGAGGGATTFEDLTDTPAYSGNADQLVAVKNAEDGLEYVDRTFEGLTDSPAYSGNANKLLAVNAGETAVEFVDPDFTTLSDTPADYSGQANKLLAVNAGETAVEYIDRDFTVLGDTPADYTGHANKLVAVNAGETALEFVTQASQVEEFNQEVVTTASATSSPTLTNTPLGGGTANTASGYKIRVSRNGVGLLHADPANANDEFKYNSGPNTVEWGGVGLASGEYILIEYWS